MRDQVSGVRCQGKRKRLFAFSLAPGTWSLKPDSRGFSLVELMVAVSLFAVIMLVAVGALLSLLDANRKARSLESVMNNLNIAIDGMVRSVRMGSAYNCNSESIPNGDIGGDCSEGGDLFSFSPFGADPAIAIERWVYSFENGQIWRSREGGAGAVAITAPEVEIEDVNFYTVGTARGNGASTDTAQPKVVIVIKGTAGSEASRSVSNFYIQATAVQRLLDL